MVGHDDDSGRVLRNVQRGYSLEVVAEGFVMKAPSRQSHCAVGLADRPKPEILLPYLYKPPEQSRMHDYHGDAEYVLTDRSMNIYFRTLK